MKNHRISHITKRLIEIRAVTDQDLKLLRKAIDEDDAYTREEVEDILAVEQANVRPCAGWDDFVTAVVVDHIVWERRPTGYVRKEDAHWLMDRLGGRKAPVGSRARALVRAVAREAERTDDSLIAFAMGAPPDHARYVADLDPSARRLSA